ncbi:MAG TPA: cytochrome c oxidase assembly factor Coa1 family protein [Xanthomonadaceae bacterium]|nr:cytochrome c oxidase assembly factor Coa1 family protein [Xanthomonadaceae bacterium]
MAESQAPGWFQRNWKWAVPVGCLTMLLVALLFVFMLMVVVFGAMRSSDVHEQAVAMARAHPGVTAALGTPIEEGFFVSGNINVSGPSGEAQLAIPLSGPMDSGTLYVEATRSTGLWRYQLLQLEVEADGRRIDLLPEP